MERRRRKVRFYQEFLNILGTMELMINRLDKLGEQYILLIPPRRQLLMRFAQEPH